MSDAADSDESTIFAYAEVAVVRGMPGSAGALTYAVPADMELSPGQAVWVPLRKKLALGIVLRLHDRAPSFATRPIHALLDPPFALDPARVDAGLWLARETAASPFAALSPFLPPGRSQRIAETLRLLDPTINRASLTPTQRRLVDLLASRGEIGLDAARSALGSSLASVVPALERLGAVERTQEVAARS